MNPRPPEKVIQLVDGGIGTRDLLIASVTPILLGQAASMQSTIHFQYKSKCDPRSCKNNVSGWKRTLGWPGIEPWTLQLNEGNSVSIKLIKPTRWQANCEFVIYPLLEMAWLEIYEINHVLNCRQRYESECMWSWGCTNNLRGKKKQESNPDLS